ncbi:MAG: hypothetical protein NXI25_17465 [bacterium]|nr:hypothetical protein [bacterium]
MKKLLWILILPLLWASCDKQETEHGGGNGNNAPNEPVLEDAIDEAFPFTPNQPFGALYYCGRLGSQLSWYFLFAADHTLQVLFTTDAHQNYAFNGSYTYASDELRLQMPGGPASPFPQGLDERSTVIMPSMGLVGAFATPQMVCVCMGHDLNPQDPPQAEANYDCPTINVQAATDEDNAIELMHRSVPYEFAVPGSIFRQQDTYVSGMNHPQVRRGYGIYRTDGNRFYANFRLAQDLYEYAAPGQLPVNLEPGVPFTDHNLISGQIQAGYQELTVDQLSPEAGPCRLR